MVENNNKENSYVVEMLNIRKEFPGIVANDNITLKLKSGEIHALLGENGAGKSTLMSILFGLYQPDEGIIKKDGKVVKINNPNDATNLHIGMVHQHFKLVECFSVIDNIILGVEPTKYRFLYKNEAKKRVLELSEKYGMKIDIDAKVENITVGMQQRVEILKMLYRNNEVLIFDEPTAVLTPQEIKELLITMKNFAKEGKSILFITHKMNEIFAVADRCTVLRKGKYVGTIDIKDTNKEKLSEMMIGHKISFTVDKKPAVPKETILNVNNISLISKFNKKKKAVSNVSFEVKSGEILCIAGIDGNGQSELVYGITGLEKLSEGSITLCGHDISKVSVRKRNIYGMSHIPEDRHKYGLVLDFPLENNMVLQSYWQPQFSNKFGYLNRKEIQHYTRMLISLYDIRCGQGPITMARSMSGGNQQKAIIARELDRPHKLLVAVQPTRGLDVGAVSYIHKQLVNTRDNGAAVLLISLEIDEVMDLADRILVMFEGEIVAEVDPKKTTVEELGLYMSGAKRNINRRVV